MTDGQREGGKGGGKGDKRQAMTKDKGKLHKTSQPLIRLKSGRQKTEVQKTSKPFICANSGRQKRKDRGEKYKEETKTPRKTTRGTFIAVRQLGYFHDKEKSRQAKTTFSFFAQDVQAI